MVLRDPDVREDLLRFLEEGFPGDHILEELPFERAGVRADVVRVATDTIVGYEIKSDADKLVRLPGQISGYDSICDLSYVVTTEAHLIEVARMVPEHWGILVLYESHAGRTFVEHRQASEHDRVRHRDRLALLWRTDLMEALREAGVKRGVSKKSKAKLSKLLSEHCDQEKQTEIVIAKLRTRGRRGYDFS